MGSDQPRNNLEYLQAMHGIQTGVDYDQHRRPDSNKHLRVGINSAMINDAALARLLISKGVFTQEEYTEQVRLEANRELDRYEDIIREHGTNIILR